SETELAKMQGYTTLQRVIARYSADHAPKHIISSQYLPDRWKLTLYYIADAILHTNGDVFSLAELHHRYARDAEDQAALLNIWPQELDEFIDSLMHAGVLEETTEPLDRRVIVADVPETSSRRFRLSRPFLAEMGGDVADLKSESVRAASHEPRVEDTDPGDGD